VVVYCALDREFAEAIFADFTRQTGLQVVPHFDTEANKSVGLYEELIREAAQPRCDVHWNNEILATVRLHKRGVLEPYSSPARFVPTLPSCQEPAGAWHAFAARARVLIVNTDLVPRADWPVSILDLTMPAWNKRVAIAKPQFGTTATQATCLFQTWGRDRAEKFFRDLRANGVHIVAGNKQVAVGVGRGQFAVGLTDTDDAIAEIAAGHPVAIVYLDRDAPNDSGGTLFIPNTLALVRGAPNPAGGRRLIDYLLSPEVEAKLARADSKQIPLNPAVKTTLPREIETPATVHAMPVDFDKAADLWDDVQRFLTKEFARP